MSEGVELAYTLTDAGGAVCSLQRGPMSQTFHEDYDISDQHGRVRTADGTQRTAWGLVVSQVGSAPSKTANQQRLALSQTAVPGVASLYSRLGA